MELILHMQRLVYFPGPGREQGGPEAVQDAKEAPEAPEQLESRPTPPVGS